MPIEEDVIEDAVKEIKAIGDDVKGLQTSTKKDLHDIRKLVEDAPKAVLESPQFKKDMEALTSGVLTKHDALALKVKEIEEKAVKGATDRLDDLEKKLNRSKIGGGAWGNDDDGTKAAKAFAKDAAALRGELKVATDLDSLDLEQVKAYAGAYPRFMRRDQNLASADDFKTMSVGSDPDGGYMVTPTIGAIIQGVFFETSPMRQIANIETISSDSIEYPRDDDQASGGWVGEQETRAVTNTPQGGMQRIPVHELYALPKVTQKLLEDASWPVDTWLGRKIGEIFSRTEATAFVTGNGVKRPRGFTTYASGTFSAGGSGKIEQVAAATAGAVGWDDLINLMGALKDFYANGAVWLMKRATVTSLMLLKDGQGRYIWSPNQQAGKPSVLLGSDVYQAADMDGITGGTKLPIAFGNFKMGYTIVDRIGISTLRDPYSAKPFVQFYTRKRVGGDVTNFEAIKLLAVA
jgi:HK97 family phage major capsid protein